MNTVQRLRKIIKETEEQRLIDSELIDEVFFQNIEYKLKGYLKALDDVNRAIETTENDDEEVEHLYFDKGFGEALSKVRLKIKELRG